ncbi:hypothetical protein [Luethyella okanaganae]|uniref:MacB-like periplasmic core domain-containing protein n=1 Tax=Luethyella okanaganae TaxID=69372 RepID=A0ABW1V975_9MICO
MIGYQLGTAVKELVSLRFRTFLLILQVVVVAASLSLTLNDTLRSANDLRLASELGVENVSYFTIYYDDARAPDINERMGTLLADTLNAKTADYSVIKNNYFDGAQLDAPILVVLGGFADAYHLPNDTAEHDAVLIGSNVHQYQPGDVLELGTRHVTIDGRLTAGASYLDPWMGYDSLDDRIVLLSTYERFSEANAADVWQQEVVGRTVLFDPSDQLIDSYVEAASSTGGIEVVPQHLSQRVSTVYEAQLGKSGMFLLFFACLLIVLLGTIVSTVDALIASNLRRYSIERLYGANNGHIVLRVNLFLAAAFSVPSTLIFAGFAAVTVNVGQVLAIAIAAVLVAHVILSIRVLVTLRRASVTSMLRKE